MRFTADQSQRFFKKLKLYRMKPNCGNWLWSGGSMNELRACARCKMLLPVSDFYQRTENLRTGYLSYCKSCMREIGREKYEIRKQQKRVSDKQKEPLEFIHPKSLIAMAEENTTKFKIKKRQELLSAKLNDFTKYETEGRTKYG